MGKGRFVSLSVFNRAHAGAESEESLYSVLSWGVSKSVNEIFMVLLDLITLWKFKEERQVSLQNKINRLKIGPARRTSLDMRVVKVSGLEKIIAISKPERTRGTEAPTGDRRALQTHQSCALPWSFCSKMWCYVWMAFRQHCSELEEEKQKRGEQSLCFAFTKVC